MPELLRFEIHTARTSESRWSLADVVYTATWERARELARVYKAEGLRVKLRKENIVTTGEEEL